MGNRANARRAAQKLTHDARSVDSPGSPSMETGASQRSADRAIDVAARFLRFVPNPETSRTIVDYYVSTCKVQRGRRRLTTEAPPASLTGLSGIPR